MMVDVETTRFFVEALRGSPTLNDAHASRQNGQRSKEPRLRQQEDTKQMYRLGHHRVPRQVYMGRFALFQRRHDTLILAYLNTLREHINSNLYCRTRHHIYAYIDKLNIP